MATAGIPRQDALLFDEPLTPGPARDLSDSPGDGNAAGDVPEHLVADRSTLRRILFTGLENVARFGARVTGNHRDPDAGITVDLANGHRAEAGVLIGADGINSAVAAHRVPHLTTIGLEARHIAAKIPLTDKADLPSPAREVVSPGGAVATGRGRQSPGLSDRIAGRFGAGGPVPGGGPLSRPDPGR